MSALLLLLPLAVAAPPRVGDWSTFALRRGAEPAVYLRVAVVAEERGRQWVELEVGAEPSMQAPLGQVAALTDPSRPLGADSIERLFLGGGPLPPAEASTALLRATHPLDASRDPGEPPPEVSVQPERLRTPAGAFRARRVELRRGGTVVERIWLSDEVPVVPLVKLEVPPVGASLEVWAVGHDAVPRVHGQSSSSLPPFEGYYAPPARNHGSRSTASASSLPQRPPRAEPWAGDGRVLDDQRHPGHLADDRQLVEGAPQALRQLRGADERARGDAVGVPHVLRRHLPGPQLPLPMSERASEPPRAGTVPGEVSSLTRFLAHGYHRRAASPGGRKRC